MPLKEIHVRSDESLRTVHINYDTTVKITDRLVTWNDVKELLGLLFPGHYVFVGIAIQNNIPNYFFGDTTDHAPFGHAIEEEIGSYDDYYHGQLFVAKSRIGSFGFNRLCMHDYPGDSEREAKDNIYGLIGRVNRSLFLQDTRVEIEDELFYHYYPSDGLLFTSLSPR